MTSCPFRNHIYYVVQACLLVPKINLGKGIILLLIFVTMFTVLYSNKIYASNEQPPTPSVTPYSAKFQQKTQYVS